jgi:hypothetical protein
MSHMAYNVGRWTWEMVVADAVMDRNETGAAIWNKHVVSTAGLRAMSNMACSM